MYNPLIITTMKKMLVLGLALSVFAVGSVFANDSALDDVRGPRKVNVSFVLGTPPPPPASHCCGHHHRPVPPKHHGHPGGHRYEGKHHHHHHFDGRGSKPGHGHAAVRPGNHNGHRHPANGSHPGGPNRNDPPRGGNRR